MSTQITTHWDHMGTIAREGQSKFCPACPYPQVIPDLGCAEIFMLVMQIYVGIGLLVLCIYVALKCGAFRRSADTANGYQRMEQPSRQTNE